MMKNLSLTLVLVLSIVFSDFARCEARIPTSEFARYAGIRVHYRNLGQGTSALILVHGWTCNSQFWNRSIGAFREYRVIAIDLPGHGQSDKPHIDYTANYFARSIEAVMRDASVDRAVLVGHSMGTPIIQQFYHLFPNKTLGLVIVDGSLLPVTQDAKAERVMASLRADYEGAATKFVDEMLQPIHDVKLRSEIRSMMLATPDYVGLSAVEGMMGEGARTYDKISVPVLAILADTGAWEPDTEASFRLIAPNLDFQMWPGVSHFLMMERPLAFNQYIRHFLSGNGLLRTADSE